MFSWTVIMAAKWKLIEDKAMIATLLFFTMIGDGGLLIFAINTFVK